MKTRVERRPRRADRDDDSDRPRPRRRARRRNRRRSWLSDARYALRGAWRRIAARFRAAPGHPRPQHWVYWRIGLAGTIGLVVGLLMNVVEMIGSPRVFLETWSDGVVIQPDAPIDIVDWARAGAGEDAGPGAVVGLDIGDDSLTVPYSHIAGPAQTEAGMAAALAAGTGGFIRSFGVTGECQVRLWFRPVSRMEVVVTRLGDGDTAAPCRVSGELDPRTVVAGTDTEWGGVPVGSIEIPPRDVTEPVRVQFEHVPGRHRLAAGRFTVSGIGYRDADEEERVSLIHGGVLRLVDFASDGEDEVRVLDRVVGRGHPIYRGDDIALGTLRAEVLSLEVEDMVHMQLRGKASAPHLAGRNLEPRLLQQSNEQNTLLWIAALALGFMALYASMIEAAR